ncbi:MAG: CPBP family intramembrane glutamic endopeptidase [Holdemanella porci]
MRNKLCISILKVQLLIGILITLLFSLNVRHTPPLPKSIYLCLLCALSIIFTLMLLQDKKRYIQITVKWLSIFILPFAFNFLVYTGISFLNIEMPNLAVFFSITGCILLLVVNIPWVIVDLPIVKNTFVRLISVIIIDLSYMFNVNGLANTSDFVQFILNSGLLITVEELIIIFFVARAWKLKFSWNLKFIKTSDFQLWALLLLMSLIVWLIFLNIHLQLEDNWIDLLCFWRWNDYGIIHRFTAEVIAASARAGVLEETIRGLEIIIVLYGLQNFKYKVEIALVASAGLFSLGHFGNLGTTLFGTYYSASIIEQQMVSTFGFGLVMGVLYLYTGKLWLCMLSHFLWDIEALGVVTTTTIFTGWLSVVILLIVSVVIAIWMLTGKRRKFMEDNANRIVAM